MEETSQKVILWSIEIAKARLLESEYNEVKC
jgi:hypothetical protein